MQPAGVDASLLDMAKLLQLPIGLLLLAAAACQREKCIDPAPATPPAACSLTPETGVCNAAFVRYYYDPKEGKCKPFTWGGCGGVVPFVTLHECQVCEST